MPLPNFDRSRCLIQALPHRGSFISIVWVLSRESESEWRCLVRLNDEDSLCAIDIETPAQVACHIHLLNGAGPPRQGSRCGRHVWRPFCGAVAVGETNVRQSPVLKREEWYSLLGSPHHKSLGFLNRPPTLFCPSDLLYSTYQCIEPARLRNACDLHRFASIASSMSRSRRGRRRPTVKTHISLEIYTMNSPDGQFNTYLTK